MNNNIHFSLLQYVPTSTFVALIKYCVRSLQPPTMNFR
jgi:hypothetical protein